MSAAAEEQWNHPYPTYALRGKPERRRPQVGRHVLEERQRDGKLRATLPQPRKQRFEWRRPARVTGAVGKKNHSDVSHRTIMAVSERAGWLAAPYRPEK